MHELGIALNIIKIVNAELSARGLAPPVEKIRFKVGKLHAVIPDSLVFHFDIVKKEHPQLAGASLAIEEVPVVVRCTRCHQERTLGEPVFACGECGGAVEVIAGEEMELEGITL